MIAEVGWFRVFGYSLLALRCLSILCGAVALTALGSIVSKLTKNIPTALITMLLAATDYFFLTRATDGRMDIMADAFMLCGLAGYLWLRDNSLIKAVGVAGLFAAASFFTHPVGGFFSLCAVGTSGLLLDRRRLRLRHGVLFALPFLAIGACWGSYVLQDVPAFSTQMAGNAHGRWEGVSNLYWSVYRELRYKYFQAYGLNSFNFLSLQHLRLVALIVYLMSVVTVSIVPAVRRKAGAGTLLAITLVFVFGGMAFDGAKRWYYLVYVVPLFAAMTAICFEWLWSKGRGPRLVAGATLASLLMTQIGGTVYRIRKNDYQNKFIPAADFVKRHNPQHGLIFGGGELGFADGFPNYLVDDISLGYFSGKRASLIFVPEVYWGIWMGDLKDRAPAVGKFISQTLTNDYVLTFQNSAYRVYERKN